MKNHKTKLQIVLIVLVVSTILIAVPEIPKSYAHAFVTKSDPSPLQSLDTPPTKVDIYLNDPVDNKYSRIKVLDSDGKEIQENDQHYINNDQTTLSVSLPPNLKNGVYTVSIKVLDQTDGHVTESAFVFAVGQPVPQNLASAQPTSNYQILSVPEAIARFPSLVGEIMISGALVSTLWLWGPLSRVSPASTLDLKTQIDKFMLRWVTVGSVILVVANIAMISVQAYSINAGILDAISTKFGNIWTIRMILSISLFCLSFATYQKAKKYPMKLPKQSILILVGISFGVLATSSLISHGAATGMVILFLLDFVHNVFASLWIGGVMYLAFVIMPHLRKNKNDFNIAVISALIPRFSILVSAVLGAAAITGPFLLYMIEGNPALTLASFYGKVLIVKLLLISTIIAFGAHNQTTIYKKADKLILTNIQKNHSEESASNSNQVINKFNSNIKIEAFLGIALIASIAVLVDSGLPSSEFQNQLQSLTNNVFAIDSSSSDMFTQTKFIENGSRVILSISPFSTGNNNFAISFLDSNKNPIDMKSVQIKFTQTDSGIGPITTDANKTSDGIFSTNTDFGFPGHWTVRVEGVQAKENSLNLVTSYDLFVKPPLTSLVTDLKEFKTPENSSLPLYPVYDSGRNKVWAGDTAIKSGEILEFDPNLGKYSVHKLDGINIVTFLVLDSHDTIWYTDPLTGVIGNYNPSDQSNKVYPLPSTTILSGIAIDSNNTIWLTGANTAEVLKFDTNSHKFDSIKLASGSDPLGITIDSTNKVWITEGTGKIASINPSNSKIEEYTPTYANYSSSSPTAILQDPQTGKLFISLHDDHAITVFDPLLKTFDMIKLDSDDKALPFGMVFDKYHNLWVAQHTLDKISIVDTRTGKYIEKDIPTQNSFVQWLTSDPQGNIIFAEQRGNALGTISITANPTVGSGQSTQASLPLGMLPTNSSYSQIAAPSIAVLLIAVAFFYSKGVIDLRNSLSKIRKAHS